jgi:hypothetical protein
MELCGKASVNSMTLCRPLLYGLHAAPLERGRQTPRKGYRRLPHARGGRRCDVELVERVPSANFFPVWPCPPLYNHPEHCSTILDAMRAHDDKTPPHLLLCDLWTSVSLALKLMYERRPDKRFPRHHPRIRSWAGTGLAMTHAGSEVRQDDQPLHGVVHHTAICSLDLCGTIVNRLPLAYKRRGRSPGHGRGQSGTLAFFRLHHDIGTPPQSNLRDLEAPPPLPPCL